MSVGIKDARAKQRRGEGGMRCSRRSGPHEPLCLGADPSVTDSESESDAGRRAISWGRRRALLLEPARARDSGGRRAMTRLAPIQTAAGACALRLLAATWAARVVGGDGPAYCRDSRIAPRADPARDAGQARGQRAGR